MAEASRLPAAVVPTRHTPLATLDAIVPIQPHTRVIVEASVDEPVLMPTQRRAVIHE